MYQNIPLSEEAIKTILAQCPNLNLDELTILKQALLNIQDIQFLESNMVKNVPIPKGCSVFPRGAL